jgi:hypothetical protein
VQAVHRFSTGRRQVPCKRETLLPAAHVLETTVQAFDERTIEARRLQHKSGIVAAAHIAGTVRNVHY